MAVSVSTINLTGTLEGVDKATMQRCAAQENAWRTEQNTANLNVPGWTPLLLFPVGTNAELKTATEAYMLRIAQGSWASYKQQTINTDEANVKISVIRDYWPILTDAERIQVQTLVQQLASN